MKLIAYSHLVPTLNMSGDIPPLLLYTGGPGYLSRYSDLPWAARSGYRISVEARLSAPVQTGPRPHPASYTMGTGSLSRG